GITNMLGGLKADSRAYREHCLRTGVGRESGVPKNLYIRGDVHSLEDCRFIEELGDPFAVPHSGVSGKAVICLVPTDRKPELVGTIAADRVVPHRTRRI